jgi:D-glycero-alpha-D-manno-heptose 1-phosphate guanylyltransferase
VNVAYEAIVLAGGFGTRLRKVVAEVPKPMAPIVGKPFLTLLLEFLAKQDVRRVILCVGYLREVIISHFGERLGPLEIVYSVEDEPLGTGGAIAQALKMVESRNVFVLNGDTFLKMDYRIMELAHISSTSTLTMAVREVSDVSRYDEIVLKDDRIVEVRAAPEARAGLINGGVYLMGSDLFNGFDLPLQFSFEREFLPRFVARSSPVAFRVQDYFIDIGVPEDYRRAQLELAAQANR